MSKSINLLYSSQGSCCFENESSFDFFKKIRGMNEEITAFKKDQIINDFNRKDSIEVSRHNTYAVFPELMALIKQGKTISLDDIREQLKNRKITDKTFQNKALAMLLQNKIGVHFGLSSVCLSLLHENSHSFYIEQKQNVVNFEVKNKDHIQFIYSTNLYETNGNPAPALSLRIEIDITPSKVILRNVEITQLVNSPEANEAFDFLNNNQAALWERIIIFLKTIFGYNNNIELENEETDKISWQSNTKAY